MAVYMLVDTKIKDLDAYEEYKLKAKPIVESYGGEYLTRGGYTTVPENELWTPTRLVIVRFPLRKTQKPSLLLMNTPQSKLSAAMLPNLRLPLLMVFD